MKNAIIKPPASGSAAPVARPAAFRWPSRAVEPEERHMLWTLRANGGKRLLARFPCRDYAWRIAVRLQGLGLVEISGGAARARELMLTERGNGFLDRMMRAE